MTKIDKRLSDLYALAEQGKDLHDEGSPSRMHFHAILCQLSMLGRDLEDFYLIEKCRCCCGET